jgi:hypothetical protein
MNSRRLMGRLATSEHIRLCPQDPPDLPTPLPFCVSTLSGKTAVFSLFCWLSGGESAQLRHFTQLTSCKRRPSNIANFDGRQLIEASLEFMSGRWRRSFIAAQTRVSTCKVGPLSRIPHHQRIITLMYISRHSWRE